jgi:hypothetical protein
VAEPQHEVMLPASNMVPDFVGFVVPGLDQGGNLRIHKIAPFVLFVLACRNSTKSSASRANGSGSCLACSKSWSAMVMATFVAAPPDAGLSSAPGVRRDASGVLPASCRVTTTPCIGPYAALRSRRIRSRTAWANRPERE